MQGLQAALGLEGEDLWQVAAGFGGGIARRQLACGAVTGATMACGLAIAQRQGATREGRDALRTETYATVQQLAREFEAELGALDCRTLTGHDFSTPSGYEAFHQSDTRDRVCRRAVRFAVESVARSLADGG